MVVTPSSSRTSDGRTVPWTPCWIMPCWMAPCSTGCGLISRNISQPAWRRCETAAVKFTGSVRFLAQYSASGPGAGFSNGHRGRESTDASRVRIGEAPQLVAAASLQPMGGHLDVDGPAEHAGTWSPHQAGQLLVSSRHDGGPRAVARGDGDAVPPAHQQRRGLLRAHPHEHHPALPTQPPEEPAPNCDHARGVFQRQRPRHMGSRHLAHAVPHDGVRPDPPGPPQRGEGNLDGEEHGLDDVDLVTDQHGSRRAGDHRPLEMRAQCGRTARPRHGTRLSGEEIAPHAGPLAPWPEASRAAPRPAR
jgi:hypothetical protein